MNLGFPGDCSGQLRTVAVVKNVVSLQILGKDFVPRVDTEPLHLRSNPVSHLVA